MYFTKHLRKFKPIFKYLNFLVQLFLSMTVFMLNFVTASCRRFEKFYAWNQSAFTYDVLPQTMPRCEYFIDSFTFLIIWLLNVWYYYAVPFASQSLLIWLSHVEDMIKKLLMSSDYLFQVVIFRFVVLNTYGRVSIYLNLLF